MSEADPSSLPHHPPQARRRSGYSVTAEQVVAHVRALIHDALLRPGDRLPTERELAHQMGVSRASVRAGLRTLATMGVIESRQGAGTFIKGGPPALDSEPLQLIAALHGLSRDGVFETRQVLEAGAAALAAERAAGEQLAAISDAVTGMYAALGAPPEFLLHDVIFHRAVATATGNPVLGLLIDMLASIDYEQRRATIELAHDLRETAEEHRRIYQAIRGRQAEAARSAMEQHLRRTRADPSAERPSAG